jgi:hypothetical protein
MAKNSKKEVKEEPEEELMEDFIKFVKQEAEDEGVKEDTEEEELMEDDKEVEMKL